MPDDLYFEKNHSWLRLEGDIGIVGIDDFAQKLAGEIKYVGMPVTGDEVEQGKPFGTIESGKWVGKLYAPVSGEIVDINSDVEDDPALINSSPYQDGWIVKIKLSNKDELKNLLKGSAVEEWLKSEITKYKK
jgi:glycine cleavage system H protein